MARISPLRMSKETPVIALTPPKESETSSTESSTSRAAISWALGALMRPCPVRARSYVALPFGKLGIPPPERERGEVHCGAAVP